MYNIFKTALLMGLFSLTAPNVIWSMENKTMSDEDFPVPHEITDAMDVFYDSYYHTANRIRNKINLIKNALQHRDSNPTIPVNGAEFDKATRLLEDTAKQVENIWELIPQRTLRPQEQHAFTEALNEQIGTAKRIHRIFTKQQHQISFQNMHTLNIALQDAANEHDRRISFMANLPVDSFDLLLITFGARGYQHQEVPAFVHSLPENIHTTILSIGNDWDKTSSAAQPGPNLARAACALNLSLISITPSSAIESFHKPLHLLNMLSNPVVMFEHVAGRPNIRLISMPFKFPTKKLSYAYKKARNGLKCLITRAIENNRAVIIGNNTQAFSWDGVDVLAKIYHQLSAMSRATHQFAAYTQGSDGQCIVYNPARYNWQGPITQDPTGKFFMPYKQVGLPVATFSYDSFCDGSFGFDLQKDQSGTHIVGLHGQTQPPQYINTP